MSENQGKKATQYKNRYNHENYDSLRIVVPKGQKAAIQAHAESKGESINAMVARAILADMGLTEWPETDDAQK